MNSIKHISLFIAAIMSVAALSSSNSFADHADTHKVVGGVEIYLGILPVEILRGRETMRHEEMHRGSPVGRNAYHLVAALFDRDSGNRITQANVSATVHAPGKAPLKKGLEPMMVADAVTFGNYFTLPSSLSSKIELTIELGNKQKLVAEFDHTQNLD